jgi:phenylacetic acid degradation operon negative regulatory protein
VVPTFSDDGALTPFDIESIFPDEANAPGRGAVRLPRKHSGNSPQELAVTLVADYTLRHRAWLPSSALVALLCESGVSEAGARTVISRLSRRGLLEGRRDGRRSSYRLAAPVAAHLRDAGRWIAGFALGEESWDGVWTLVAFSLPREAPVARRRLRGQLRWVGFAPLYDGLWVSARPPDAGVLAHLEGLPDGVLTVFRARHQEIGSIVQRDPITAWDLPSIAEAYRLFLRDWDPVHRRVSRRQVRGAEAVQVRTAVMDTYRRFPVLDPRLPGELLPPDWPRNVVRDLFIEVYDGLAGVAEDHVRAVAAAGTGDVAGDDAGIPQLAAHTVAEMAQGLTGPAGQQRAGRQPAGQQLPVNS